jgi:NAD(P)-dependent dehydrogenase (short-subunit alcohol dehydrogenase family)
MTSTINVNGKKCLVTGSSDPLSIGYACAKAMVDNGAAAVTVSGRSKVEEAAASLAPAVSGSSISCTCYGIVSDLYKPETMKDLVEAAVAKMGGLDILIVCGANGGSEYLGLDVNDVNSYRTMQDVAVHSPMMLARAAFSHLKAAVGGGGSIVMVSSMAPLVPWPNTAPYNLARAAQNCLVETLAFEYRNDNVRVNAILPACIHTGYLDIMAEKKNIPLADYAQLRASAHPIPRNGTADECAQAVLYLASSVSSWTTGELLKVDGGLHLSNWWNKPALLDQYVGGNLTGKS